MSTLKLITVKKIKMQNFLVGKFIELFQWNIWYYIKLFELRLIGTYMCNWNPEWKLIQEMWKASHSSANAYRNLVEKYLRKFFIVSIVLIIH